jgi:hypothetical protein
MTEAEADRVAVEPPIPPPPPYAAKGCCVSPESEAIDGLLPVVLMELDALSWRCR